MGPVESFATNHPLSLLALNVFGDQLGLPLPSYPSLVLAGAFASEQGSPDPALIVALAMLCCLLADSLWFCLGARFGDALTRRIERSSPRMSTALAQGRKAYLRHGPVVLVFARFIPGAGAVSTLLAGQIGMARTHFVACSLLGSMLWSGSALALGAGFGEAILHAFDSLKEYLELGLVTLGVAVLTLLVLRVAPSALRHAMGRPLCR
ncbi:DedA family protein [Pseudomonas sp. 148P]|uniref:DedA family protein n=1 Tax=Pseudomonas ulcerans TaxID=3115852 RepID=A0ABU7HK50_9PSED|nr:MULTISPECIES: DedA family protein [unclassified Pseudomonas]MEE1922268.1 DedA family protein [Pseudomonas sp. 147P]MEE1931913.1 DedA family protein [Pseudomonas sp. 148P]